MHVDLGTVDVVRVAIIQDGCARCPAVESNLELVHVQTHDSSSSYIEPTSTLVVDAADEVAFMLQIEDASWIAPGDLA